MESWGSRSRYPRTRDVAMSGGSLASGTRRGSCSGRRRVKEPGDRYHLGIDWYAGLEYLGSLGVGRRSGLVVSVEREPGRGEVVAITRPGGLGAGPAG